MNEVQMQVTRKGAFTVVGRLGQGPSRFGPVWIRPLWRDLQQEFSQILHLIRRGRDGEATGMWGLMSDARAYLAPWGEEGRYLAGCEVNPGVSPPKGWTLWNIPEQTYLVVSCPRDHYQETYDRVMRDLLGSDRYSLAGAAHEFYPPGKDREIDFYIPILPKQNALGGKLQNQL